MIICTENLGLVDICGLLVRSYFAKSHDALREQVDAISTNQVLEDKGTVH